MSFKHEFISSHPIFVFFPHCCIKFNQKYHKYQRATHKAETSTNIFTKLLLNRDVISIINYFIISILDSCPS